MCRECCEPEFGGPANLRIREADESYGPEKAGWSMPCGSTDYGGADFYCNINFCPWCGRQLVDDPVMNEKE